MSFTNTNDRLLDEVSLSYGSTQSSSQTSHRYLDVMTIRPSQGARLSSNNLAHTNHGFSKPGKQFLLSISSNNTFPGVSPSHSQLKQNSLAYSNHLSSSTNVPLNSSVDLNTISKLNSTSSNSNSIHSSLLIEPILLPNIQHISIDNPQDLEESACLFYPNGQKNKNMRREIETSILKHQMISRSVLKNKIKPKDNKIKQAKYDPYADVKPSTLYFKKEEKDPESVEILKTMREREKKIKNLLHIQY